MKSITAKCTKCLEIITFTGKDAQQIIKDIDASGWTDRPADNGRIEFLCPACTKKDNG